MNIDDIELVERFPDVDDYRRLRAAAGLSRKAAEAAEGGLRGTLYGVSLLRAGEIVGMGRVIGDGGCFYFVVDVAVEPALQGRGLGRRVMQALDAWVRANAPATAHVSLIADGDARYLYEKFGFVELQRAVAMAYTIQPADDGSA